MSKEKALEERPTTDIVGRDQEILKEFMEAGLPGIADADEKKTAKMFDLYLNGQNYTQISNILRVPKGVILYLSHRCKWFEHRQEFLIGLEENNKRRIIETKLMSQDILLKAIQMWHKKFGSKINRYLREESDDMTPQNLKEFDRYLKTLDLLQKSIALPETKSPLVNVNLGNNATITKTGDNEIEITANSPKESAKLNMLKYYADLERENDKKK